MVKVLRILTLSIGLAIMLALPLIAQSDVHDPFDPFDRPSSGLTEPDSDQNKTSEELIAEAALLLEDERPLDARTKLLKALEKDPKQYRAHTLLAGYYMVHVGHFRLALKYVKQAMALFEAKNGQPPYQDYILKSEHAQLLYLLSQARLNLDDYQGALEVLDQFTATGYSAEWYAGTRAWVLMKLGRIDEAIKVARLGIISGAEPGRSLNMLGILLSMKGERSASISIFRDAIAYELSLGSSGQPATPLNNTGEVFKETFDEDKAESSWLRATSMPDGCEHVLPSLNLSLLYIDELNFAGAKRAMDNFESCVAQFPLRNGEEHRALVNLARGRIALHTGHVDLAIKLLEDSLQHQQWFGKIGTNLDDLRAAALISLASALEVKNHQLEFTLFSSTLDWLQAVKIRTSNKLRSWWLMRRARQIVTEDLANLEDIYIRNTDSLIEYGTFGSVLADLPLRALQNRISTEQSSDDRKEASLFYQAYTAENLLRHGNRGQAIEMLNLVINKARPSYDNLLRLHAILTLLGTLSTSSPDYASLANHAYNLSRASLRNYGFALPVNYDQEDEEMKRELERGPFILDNSKDLQYSVSFERENNEVELRFRSNIQGMMDIKVRGPDLIDAVNKLSEEVFTMDVK